MRPLVMDFTVDAEVNNIGDLDNAGLSTTV